MKIDRALDWPEVSISLMRELRSIGYNPDLHKMYKNVESMVTELSKLEVTLRHSYKNTLLQNKCQEINKAIDHLEKLIVMAKLMR